MSLEDFYLNFHVYIFFFLGFLAVVLIINAGSSYRTGKIIIGFWNFKHYTSKEQKFLTIGVVILVSSIIGLMVVLDHYGHNVRYIDEHGNVEVKNEKIEFF